MELAVVDLLPVQQDQNDDDDWAGDSDVLVLTKGRCFTTLDLDQLPLWFRSCSSAAGELNDAAGKSCRQGRAASVSPAVSMPGSPYLLLVLQRSFSSPSMVTILGTRGCKMSQFDQNRTRLGI